METLMKQIRVKLTGAEEENKADIGGSRDQKVSTQQISSFKDNKKKGQNWFQRQFSRNMSHDYDTEMEHATAVAAAAYAIFSQEVSLIPQQKKMRETPLSRGKSKVDDTKPPFSQFGSTSRQFSVDIKRPEKGMNQASSMRRSSTFGEKLKSNSDGKKPEIQPPKRTPTFSDEHLMNTGETKPETPHPKVPLPVHQPEPLKPEPLRPPPPPPPPIRQNSARPGANETKADAWEREELEKIKERYEKLLETIESWEKRKKAKAIRKLNKLQHGDSERKRGKALKKYEEKMNYINQIAGGARAQAEERRRNEVMKAKEKANIIRTTGKIPGPCSCF
ncbi:Remorin [Vigna unguiculata]|uniref:Remorin n=1 Tax=Vigna unguiculata TaxID=3917 RepID=A0A4D6L274_VIGUN|nr:Remorin [Vigna unguiculata]